MESVNSLLYLNKDDDTINTVNCKIECFVRRISSEQQQSKIAYFPLLFEKKSFFYRLNILILKDERGKITGNLNTYSI